MSADKFAGRARKLAVAAMAATPGGLWTGVRNRPPSDHPDIKRAERDGWIVRTSIPFGLLRRRGRATVFHATAAGCAALAKFGAPAETTLRGPGPSPKRKRLDAERALAMRTVARKIAAAQIARVVANPNTPPATRARLAAIVASA